MCTRICAFSCKHNSSIWVLPVVLIAWRITAVVSCRSREQQRAVHPTSGVEAVRCKAIPAAPPDAGAAACVPFFACSCAVVWWQVWVVSCVWLIVVPWITCLAWRLAFLRGFNEVRCDSSHTTAPVAAAATAELDSDHTVPAHSA